MHWRMVRRLSPTVQISATHPCLDSWTTISISRHCQMFHRETIAPEWESMMPQRACKRTVARGLKYKSRRVKIIYYLCPKSVIIKVQICLLDPGIINGTL